MFAELESKLPRSFNVIQGHNEERGERAQATV